MDVEPPEGGWVACPSPYAPRWCPPTTVPPTYVPPTVPPTLLPQQTVPGVPMVPPPGHLMKTEAEMRAKAKWKLERQLARRARRAEGGSVTANVGLLVGE